MVQKLIHRILLHRHFWRYVTLSELRELYVSSMLRSLALNLVGIFIPIYLYKLGFSVPSILFFLASIFGVRFVFNFVAGLVVSRIGAKHTIMISYVVQTLALLILVRPHHSFFSLALVSLCWGAALSFFFIAYHVDFSAIRHIQKEGRELGKLKVLEELGAVLGPLVGGLAASFIGPQYTIFAAAALFLTATLPLLMSAEPSKVPRAMNFRQFNKRHVQPHLFSFGMLQIENTITISLWPLFVAIFIFTSQTYASVGLVTSLGFAFAIAATYTIGYIVDTKQTGSMMKIALVGNAGLHLVRPFVTGFQGVLAVNIINSGVTPAYAMPYLKGWYDAINSSGDGRVTFVVIIETFGVLTKGITWLLLAFAALILSTKAAMFGGFLAAALASFGIMRHRFAALKKPRIAILK